ncbi:MAG TPA: GNAT family N-acetyltransferase [Thermomicrobiales bacterium]|nr:GNAT family N-acetyltransferase [Thermomicrobiales bacterium]
MAEITIRPAARDDVPAIVDMLADDVLGAARESPDDLTPYYEAFAVIDTHPDQMLMVAERDGRIAGTAQLTFMAGLSHRGMTRAEIEAVRVHRTARGTGLGTLLIRWCIECARRHGCGVVQLTSNASRADAHRFYARLGFEQSHVGFKMRLPPG